MDILLVMVDCCAVLCLMPRSPQYEPDSTAGEIDNVFQRDAVHKAGDKGSKDQYAIIFDCGSTASRIHVYRFNADLELQLINGELELFKQINPGLSDYRDDPSKGGQSLVVLLDQALAVVPENLQKETTVHVGATAGLRMVGVDVAKNLLDEVHKVLEKYPFKARREWVKILDGFEEGMYAWATVNYLLQNAGKPYSQTAAVVDLGGGSVQMTYAIPSDNAKNAPEKFVHSLTLKGTEYNIYTNSFLEYGLMAARGKVLAKGQSDGGHVCMSKGYEGKYTYNKVEYNADSRKEGAEFGACAKVVDKALNRDTTCDYQKCSFGGAWNGGGGKGLDTLYIASFFFDRAVEVGIIPNKDAKSAAALVSQFVTAGDTVCSLSLEEVRSKYTAVKEKDAPFLCMDIAYCATLLTKGFGVSESQRITLVKALEYNGRVVEAQWTLGLAISALN